MGISSMGVFYGLWDPFLGGNMIVSATKMLYHHKQVSSLVEVILKNKHKE
jgi:hypothetical protein